MLAPTGSVAPVAFKRYMAMASNKFDNSIPDLDLASEGVQQAVHLVRHLIELLGIGVNSLTSYLSAYALTRSMTKLSQRIIPFDPPIPLATHPFEMQMIVLSRLLQNSHDFIATTYNTLISLPYHHILLNSAGSYKALLDAVNVILSTIPMLPVHGSAFFTVEETRFVPPSAEVVAQLRAQQDLLGVLYDGDPAEGVPGWNQTWTEILRVVPSGTYPGDEK